MPWHAAGLADVELIKFNAYENHNIIKADVSLLLWCDPLPWLGAFKFIYLHLDIAFIVKDFISVYIIHNQSW